MSSPSSRPPNPRQQGACRRARLGRRGRLDSGRDPAGCGVHPDRAFRPAPRRLRAGPLHQPPVPAVLVHVRLSTALDTRAVDTASSIPSRHHASPSAWQPGRPRPISPGTWSSWCPRALSPLPSTGTGRCPSAHRSRLAEVTVPTLFINSDSDPALGRSSGEHAYRYVTGPYTFRTLTGIGHWIPEQAAPEVAELLRVHLSSSLGGTSRGL